MKKIKLLLFTILVFLISTGGIQAAIKLTCKYRPDITFTPYYTVDPQYYYLETSINSEYVQYRHGEGENERAEQFTISFILNGDVLMQTELMYEYSDGVLETEEEIYYQKKVLNLPNKEIISNNIRIDGLNLTEMSDCPEKLTLGFNKDKEFLISTKKYYGFGLTHILIISTNQKNGPSYCYNYKSPSSCNKSENKGVACVWNENKNAPNGGYCNVDNLLYVSCGDVRDIPYQIPGIISMLVNILKIATPIILIFVSTITLLKALAASKEDEIKKAQSSLIKKMIAAAIVFFVIYIVQFVVAKVASDSEKIGFSDCLSCFLNNECEDTMYYKTVVNGKDYCTLLATGKTDYCPTK